MSSDCVTAVIHGTFSLTAVVRRTSSGPNSPKPFVQGTASNSDTTVVQRTSSSSLTVIVLGPSSNSVTTTVQLWDC